MDFRSRLLATLRRLGDQYRSLAPELRYTIRSNLTTLSLLEPPKTLFLVPEERLRNVTGRTSVELRLGPERLAARFLALVPFRSREPV